MDSSHITLYYTGRQQWIADLLRDLTPLPTFTHMVIASQSPQAELTAQADTILADLREQDAAGVLRTLCGTKKASAQLIALAEPGAVPADLLSELADLWSTPVTEEELRFRLLRWQESEKRRSDFTEALKMAQVANTARNTFLGSVSHDIRTPMNAIMGFLTLLREEAGNRERVLEYAQRIESASQHLLGLINNVLDLNKIESGAAALRLSGMDLAEVIDEAGAVIRPQASEKEQSFDIRVSELTHRHLVGDRLRIHQILVNILTNAVKYTQQGGAVTMTVTELPQAAPDHSRIRFVISDNGPGMSEAFQKVVFDPFTREQGTLTNQIQGAGLGLSITKSLVDLMGGSISVRSQPGKGSAFTVELELRIQDQNVDPRFWAEHRIRRVIVVDDEEDVCTWVVRAMDKTGVHVDACTDAILAVEEICHAENAGQPYDLILLDWEMPGLGGPEICRMLRERLPNEAPILIFTAHDWDEIKQEAAQVHVTHFLPKPFFLGNLQDAVRRMKAAQKKAAAQSGSPLSGRRALVVDDMEVNRMILTKVLSTLGAACEPAGNGQEAVEKFTASPVGTYDIIMMDIQMPVMDGYEATRAIRASGRADAQSTAIVAITANAFVDDMREALASGMDAFLAKPIVVNKIITTLQEVLGAKEGR